MVEYKNVYFGENSTAHINLDKGREGVDNPHDIMVVAYALAYDCKDDLMLSHKPNVLLKRTPARVNGRFKILYILAHNHAPSTIEDIKRMHELVFKLMNYEISKKQYIEAIRSIARKYLSPAEIHTIERRIDNAQAKKSLIPAVE